MRHRVGHRKLGRVTEHRIAMLRSQAERLIQYEHIQTTVPKAKELRPFVDLGEDVDAVAVLLDHPLDAADLAFDAPQPVEELVLGCRVAAGGSHGADSTTTPRGYSGRFLLASFI